MAVFFMSIANTSAACSTACLSDTKTRLYYSSVLQLTEQRTAIPRRFLLGLMNGMVHSLLVSLAQKQFCSAAHRAKNSIMSCNMLAAHIIVLLAALLVEDKAK